MLSHFSPLAPFLKDKGDFALCGGRPNGSTLWKPATFGKVDETFTVGLICATFLFYPPFFLQAEMPPNETVRGHFHQSLFFSHFCREFTNLSISRGFAICSFIPAERAFFTSSAKASAVIAIIGIVFASGRSIDLISAAES